MLGGQVSESTWRVGRKVAARAAAQTLAALGVVAAVIVGWVLLVEVFIIRQDGYVRAGQRGEVFLLACAAAVLLVPAVVIGTRTRPVRLGVAGTLSLVFAAFTIWLLTIPGVG